LSRRANQWPFSARFTRQEGRLAIVTKRVVGCGGREGCETSAAEADGEVVWSWRPDAGAKFRGFIREATVANKPVAGESAL
jgi:alkanesulfonate monooxygenase SsuD/methylene tetrahydromethanopterin reductase-like flavin-dependent oxidoreductase (luciferase family)